MIHRCVLQNIGETFVMCMHLSFIASYFDGYGVVFIIEIVCLMYVMLKVCAFTYAITNVIRK